MESAAVSTSPPAARSPRQSAIFGVLAISLLATIALTLFSTEQAVGGAWLERIAIPARMLFLVGTASVLLHWSGSSWRSVGLAKPTSLWRTAAVVVAGYLGVGLMFAFTTQMLLPALELTPKTASVFAAVEGNLPELLYWLIPVAWGSAAIGEELVFRGYLQSRLEIAFGGVRGAAALAVVLQALVFGSLHSYQGIGGAITAGGTGLVLGIVYLAARRNLWAPIMLHGLIDTVSLIAIYFGLAAATG
jgi:uncharacterized protein